MLNLNGILDVEIIHELAGYTKLRFKDPMKYKCAEVLGLYEQSLISNDEIFKICQDAVGHELFMPAVSYLPPKILNHFGNLRNNRSCVVPVSFSPGRGTINCIYLDELGTDYIPMDRYKVNLMPAPIYYYFERYVEDFGIHPDLNVVPSKTLFQSIVNEAIALEAMDITIETIGNFARTFYNVRKRKRYSQRIISSNNMDEIIKMLCFESPMFNNSNAPKYVGVDLNEDFRGRVVINKTFKGHAITIRILPNAAFTKTLEDLTMSPETVKFIRKNMMNKEKGLRIFAGATGSGKNTSCLAILNEIVQSDTLKVVSVEMPVEQELPGVIQINSENEEEFSDNISSLLRGNPDIVYITEIGDKNAPAVMRAANTGQIVYSTLHANGCADIFGRLLDITNSEIDKLIELLHSMVYQELVRDEETDTIYPKNRYVYLSKERKNKLYGKPFGEVIKLIESWEGGDLW